jgi:hypothetical protein
MMNRPAPIVKKKCSGPAISQIRSGPLGLKCFLLSTRRGHTLQTAHNFFLLSGWSFDLMRAESFDRLTFEVRPRPSPRETYPSFSPADISTGEELGDVPLDGRSRMMPDSIERMDALSAHMRTERVEAIRAEPLL